MENAPQQDVVSIVDTKKLPMSKAAAASLIAGIFSIFCTLSVFFVQMGVTSSIAAVILGIVGLIKTKNGKLQGKQVAIVGLILGIIMVIISGSIFLNLLIYFLKHPNEGF